MKKAILTAFLTIVLVACATSPTGRRQLMLVSPDQAIDASRTAYLQQMAEFDEKGLLSTDAALIQRVQRITGRLVAQAVQRFPNTVNWEWSVAVIDDPETVNAWAMAGGRMAIYTGLIEQTQATDDEIAQVMGHEIAHALANHTAEKMSVAMASQLGVLAVGIKTEDAGAMAGAALAAQLAVNLPFSRIEGAGHRRYRDGTGDIEGYIEFSNTLPQHFYCWGIASEPLEGLAPANRTIAGIATGYIEKIKRINPNGPYYLTGWSLGGTIAYEMARQLELADEDVHFIGLIDSPAPKSNLKTDQPSFSVESEYEWLGQLLPKEKKDDILGTAENIADMDRLWTKAANYLEQTGTNKKKLLPLFPAGMARLIPDPQQLGIKDLVSRLNIQRTLIQARANYIPESNIRQSLFCLTATQSGRKHTQDWQQFCNIPMQEAEIDGDHYSILKKPGVLKLSALFNKWLIQGEKKETKKTKKG